MRFGLVMALALSGACFGACGSGSTTITGAQVVGQTYRQILIQFNVPKASAALVDVFTDAACSQEAADTLASNAANRSGSVINGVVSTGSTDGQSVVFPAGTLRGNQALAQATQYWIQIKNLADNSAVTLQASTATMPIGNLYPEQPLADASTWDNRAYPVFKWGTSNRNLKYVDPTTGLLVTPFTMPGDAWSQSGGSQDGYSNYPVYDTPVTNSGTWTNSNSAPSTYNVSNYPAPPTSGYATCSGTCDIWLPVPTIIPAYSSWDGGTHSVYGAPNGLDYFVPYVWASATSGTPVMTVSLTQTPAGNAYHGCSYSATLTNRNAGYRSADPDPGFASLCASPVLRGDLATSTGTVNTNGTSVTWVSGLYFQATWPAGSYIKIGSAFYQIASVNSATSLTLQTSAGTQSGAAYASRTMGVRIQVATGAATVSLQASYKFGISPQFQVGETFASGVVQFNQNPVTVSNDARGNPYPGYSLQGYITFIPLDGQNNGVYYLVIPKDQNGNPLGEVRVIGTTILAHSITTNGVTLSNIAMRYAGPDATNPNKWYVIVPYNNGALPLLASAYFDNTLPGCSTLWKTWSGAQTYTLLGNNLNSGGAAIDSCISYINLTNPAAGMDLRSQIVAAYSSANPGFDLGGFALGATTYLNGYFETCLLTNADPEYEVCGTFDTTGRLMQIFDTFSTYPGRWCQVHGPVYMTGTWHNVFCNFVFGANPGLPLNGPFQTTPTKVNRAGFNAAPNWSATTALDNGTADQYACPSAAQMQALGTPAGVAATLVSLGAVGNHCIQIETQGEACSTNPSTGVIWAGNTKTEAQQFPCPTNPAYSMLQKIQPGDQIMDTAMGNYGEGFMVLTKQITSPGGTCAAGAGNCIIDMWLVRGTGVWANNQHAPYPQLQAHNNGWTGQMTAPQLLGCVPIFANSATAGTHAWLEGLNTRCLSHGTASQGSSSQNIDLAYLDQNSYSAFDVAYNMDQTQGVMPPWSIGCDLCSSPVNPLFAGSTNTMTNGIQFYGDNGDTANPGQRVALFLRPLNPLLGSGAETASGMGTMGYALTPVSGTNQTYTLTDPYSAGPPNQKVIPLGGWAGAHMLTDYSGPGAGLPDSGYGMCRALNAGECIAGSTAGTTYVSVPAAAGYNQGLVGQHTQNAPAVVNVTSVAGQMTEVVLHKPDPTASHQRLMGQQLTGLGRQWQFIGPKLIPTGDWYLGTMVYRDGFTTQVGLFQAPPYIEDDVNRTGYVQVPVALGGGSATSVRIEFWYQEWNGVNGRSEHAFTSSNASAANPFLWAYEPQVYTACAAGCTINVPAISGRFLYYSVHRLTANGETADAVNVVPVP